METELTVLHAEIYDIPTAEGLYGKKLASYVREALERMHPGFNEESLWDYAKVCKGGKKAIKACVCDKGFYMEKRLEDGSVRFYIKTSDGRKARLFPPYKFSSDGSRRKGSVFVIPALLFLALCAMLLSFLFLKDGAKAETEERMEVEIETEKLPDIMYLMNEAAGVVNALGGKTDSVQFAGTGGGELVMSVSDCSAKELASALDAVKEISGTQCGEVDFKDGTERFVIRIYTVLPSFMQKEAEEAELLELMERMTGSLKEKGGLPLSALCDSRGGRIFLQMNVRREDLGKVNEALASSFREEKLFLLSFTESYTGEGEYAFISLEAVLTDEGYEDKAGGAEEKLSQIFPQKKIAVGEKKKGGVMKNIEPAGKAERGRYLKIGTVRKEGKLYGYYRTEEGKIVILGEEDE